jgi:hypothetical protein
MGPQCDQPLTLAGGGALMSVGPHMRVTFRLLGADNLQVSRDRVAVKLSVSEPGVPKSGPRARSLAWAIEMLGNTKSSCVQRGSEMFP